MTTPAAVIFDVNETLSDLTPLAARFEEAGAAELLSTWFAATLRDGIALAASGSYAGFREVGRANLLQLLPTPEAADHVLDGFAALPVHPDVPDGLRALNAAGAHRHAHERHDADRARVARARWSRGAGRALSRRLGAQPAPEPYLYACSELGVEPAEAILIAVHPWDVHGAKRAGLRGAWLDRSGVPGRSLRAPRRQRPRPAGARVLDHGNVISP